MPRVEAVTVCIGYADLIAETIPYNLPQLDHWVIVTTPDDNDTRELCRRWNLKCIVTNEVYRDGSEFNKGNAIIRGIDQLAADGWVLHIDADVVLPLHFRQAMSLAHLDPECIYGCDRIMVRSWDQWQKLKSSGFLQRDYHCRMNFPPGYDVGSRWCGGQYGYCPIGFFQLWNAACDLYKGHHTKPYPHSHNDAARGDVQMAIQFDRRNRVLIPEFLVVHLESEDAPLGANWQGRTTKRFGPANVIHRPTFG